MALELIGISRCLSCGGAGWWWQCPTCGASGEAGMAGSDEDGGRAGAVKCSGCGGDRDIVGYVVPETLTEFWVHQVRAAERIDVDYSQGKGRPRELRFRGRRVDVEELLFFVRLDDDERARGGIQLGAYTLRTELGTCVVVASPHELGGGEVAGGLTDWHLVETDDGMRRALRESRLTEAPRGSGASSMDEGLLRNVNAYGLVFRAENRLRDCLEARLESKAQPNQQWWRSVVPEGLRQEIGTARERRRQSAWFELPAVRAIELTTLGQLRHLLDEDWEYLGRGLGPKEVFLGAIRKIEFYRNELAHCRPLTLMMLHDLHLIWQMLEGIEAFGEAK